MLLNVFKSYREINILLIPLIGGLFILGSLLEGPCEIAQQSLYVSPFIDPYFQFGAHGIFSTLGAWAFVMLNCILLSLINNKFTIVKERSYLASYILVVLALAYPALHVVQPIYFASIFIILSFFCIFSLFEKKDIVIGIFEAVSLISFAAYFYFPSLLLCLLPVITIGLTSNKLRWREFFAIIWGILTPWLFIATAYFLFDEFGSFVDILSSQFILDFEFPFTGINSMIYLALLALLTLIALISLMRQYNMMKISSRKYYVILLIFMLLVICIKFEPLVHAELITLLSIPLSFLFTDHLFFSKRKFWNELFFIVLFVSSLTMQYFVR